MNELPTMYQNFIHLSRYSRWLDEKGRRETWEETVTRYMDFMKWHLEENCSYKMPQTVYKEVKSYILELKVMPSMRAMMTAGEALKRDNIANYNCSFLIADKIRCFDEMLYILLCGVGVGFSVERQFITKLPTMAEEYHPTDTTVVVGDSKMGWAKAYKEVISLLLAGQVPQWDVSGIRPAGARLKTFGGRASGSAPLVELFNFTVQTFKEAKGRKLTSFEVHKLFCKIADVVVVGGVRRASLISLSNLSDDRMRHAKSGQWWVSNPELALSNNSACYTEKPDMGIFMEEWQALYNSKSGERGIFNREAALKTIAELNKRAGFDRRNSEWEFGLNPCFTGDMRLLTDAGYASFKELSDYCSPVTEGEDSKTVTVIKPDGSESEGTVWSNGIKQVVEIRFRNRDSITCTKDHVFQTDIGDCKAKFLKDHRLVPYVEMKDDWYHDGFLAGFVQGDGCTGRLNSKSHKGLEVCFGRNDGDIAEMYGQKVGKWYSREAMRVAREWELSPEPLPTRDLPANQCTSFLAGLFSANGCVINGHRVAFKTTNKNLAVDLKQVLKVDFDINSYITVNKKKKVKFSNGEYVCKESYDLNIGTFESILKFAENISFGQAYKRKNLASLLRIKSPQVMSVKPIGKQEVFDFNEPEGHWGVVEGVIAHNCGEIILRPKSFCNLSEVIVRAEDTFDTLKDKIRIATVLGTWQASLTDFKYISSKWAENCEEEALLGVSMTGIMDNEITNGSDLYSEEYLITSLGLLREHATEVNKEWAKRIHINPAAAITCVKPSGNISQLCDTASGIHARHSEYYIRSVKVNLNDPIAQFMLDKGFPYEPDINKPETAVLFRFPIKSPEGSITRTQKTAIEQLELWMIYKEHYCDHNPSCTINVKEKEWLDVGAWVYKNFDNISGLAFLPFSEHSYTQAPYQECAKEEYDGLALAMPKGINWDDLSEFESGDMTTGSQELACVPSGKDGLGCEF